LFGSNIAEKTEHGISFLLCIFFKRSTEEEDRKLKAISLENRKDSTRDIKNKGQKRESVFVTKL